MTVSPLDSFPTRLPIPSTFPADGRLSDETQQRPPIRHQLLGAARRHVEYAQARSGCGRIHHRIPNLCRRVPVDLVQKLVQLPGRRRVQAHPVAHQCDRPFILADWLQFVENAKKSAGCRLVEQGRQNRDHNHVGRPDQFLHILTAHGGRGVDDQSPGLFRDLADGLWSSRGPWISGTRSGRRESQAIDDFWRSQSARTVWKSGACEGTGQVGRQGGLAAAALRDW